MTLGNRILELRAHLGLSQEEFGELFGSTRQTVSRWELDLAVPEIQKIVQMARICGVTTDSILSDGISTFDVTFDRFVCGVYRKKDVLIVETERIALVYLECGDTLCAELYEGLQENKTLRGTVAYALKDKKASYAYWDNRGKMTANFDAGNIIGQKFDRKQLDNMKRVETFLVERDKKTLPTVPEAGFKTCLTKWRTGTKFHCHDDQIFTCVHLNGMEYFFHMAPRQYENIYCGVTAADAFELGACIGKQYFRIRHLGDDSEKFAVSFSMINEPFQKVSPPSGENGIDFTSCDNKLEKVKRYGDDWITVTNCGDELTYYRDDKDIMERFEA